MGNSEVGHLNMGSGRIVFQEISRISNAIEDASFFSNPVFWPPLIQLAEKPEPFILWVCCLMAGYIAIASISMPCCVYV